jgi:hypothetical protein
MKCHLIDPYTRTITETEIASGDELELRILIGDDCIKTHMWVGSRRVLDLVERDALYTRSPFVMDFENWPNAQPFHWNYPSATPMTATAPGRAVILGHTVDGEPCSPTTPLDVVRTLFWFEGDR